MFCLEIWKRFDNVLKQHTYMCMPMLNYTGVNITGVQHITSITRRLPLVDQELPTLPEHLNSPPDFSGFVLLDP
jgi:hypothetical protein